MAKLTIEIDMDDSQETWEALYRRIEAYGESAEGEAGRPTSGPVVAQMTYDLLLDPERAFGEVGDFFGTIGSNGSGNTRD